jgi:hypothetical protein
MNGTLIVDHDAKNIANAANAMMTKIAHRHSINLDAKNLAN